MNETINSVYCECVNPMWEEYLNASPIKYKPVVWIGGPAFRKYDFDFYNREDAINQKIDFPRENIDENSYKELLNNEILIRMYDRFSLQIITDDTLIDRLNTWNFEFWSYIFDTYKSDALILPETPHVPYSYAGYLLAKQRGMRILYTATLPFRDLTYFIESGENYNFFRNQSFLSGNTENNENENYHNKVIADYGFKKGYVKINPVSYSRYWYNSLKNIIKNFVLDKKHRFAQIYGNELNMISLAKYQIELLKRSIRKKRNKDFYQANVIQSIPDNQKIKVIFALHFEPEQALLPLGGENYDQMRVINQLSRWLGDEGELYIKEHLWMFYYDRRGFDRDLDFYKELLKMKNVKLLDLSFNLTGEIERFDFIATITGTIGWEAFLRKKPVLVFSKPWYYGLPLIYKFDKTKSAKDILQMANEDKSRIDYQSIYEELGNMLRFSVSSVFNKTQEEYRDHAILLLKNLNNY